MADLEEFEWESEWMNEAYDTRTIYSEHLHNTSRSHRCLPRFPSSSFVDSKDFCDRLPCDLQQDVCVENRSMLTSECSPLLADHQHIYNTPIGLYESYCDHFTQTYDLYDEYCDHPEPVVPATVGLYEGYCDISDSDDDAELLSLIENDKQVLALHSATTIDVVPCVPIDVMATVVHRYPSVESALRLNSIRNDIKVCDVSEIQCKVGASYPSVLEAVMLGRYIDEHASCDENKQAGFDEEECKLVKPVVDEVIEETPVEILQTPHEQTQNRICDVINANSASSILLVGNSCVVDDQMICEDEITRHVVSNETLVETNEPLSGSVSKLQQQNPGDDSFTVVVSKKHKRHRLRQSSAEQVADEFNDTVSSGDIHMAVEHTEDKKLNDISVNCSSPVELYTCPVVNTITSNSPDISSRMGAEKPASYYPELRTLSTLATGVLHTSIQSGDSYTDGVCSVQSNAVEPDNSGAQSSDSVPLAYNYPTVQQVLQLNDTRSKFFNDIESSNEALARLAEEYPVIQESIGLYHSMVHTYDMEMPNKSSDELLKESDYQDPNVCFLDSKNNVCEQLSGDLIESVKNEVCKNAPIGISIPDNLLSEDVDIENREVLALSEQRVLIEPLSNDVKLLHTDKSDSNDYKFEADGHLNVFMGFLALRDFEMGKFIKCSKSDNILVVSDKSCLVVLPVDAKEMKEEYIDKNVPLEGLLKTNEPLAGSVSDLQQLNPEEPVEDESFTVVVSKKHKRHRLRQSSSELSADDMCHGDISDSVHLAAENTEDCKEVLDLSLNCAPSIQDVTTCPFTNTMTSNSHDIGISNEADKLASYYPGLRTLSALATGVLQTSIGLRNSDTDGVCSVESNTVEPEHSIAQSSDNVPLANNYPTVQQVLQLNDIRRKLSNDIESSNETLARLAEEYPVIRESIGVYQLMSHADIATDDMKISNISTCSDKLVKESDYQDQSSCTTGSKISLLVSQQLNEDTLFDPFEKECEKTPTISKSPYSLFKTDINHENREALALPEHEKQDTIVQLLNDENPFRTDNSVRQLNDYKFEADKHLNVFMALSALCDFEIGKFYKYTKSENIPTVVTDDSCSAEVPVIIKELSEEDVEKKDVRLESMIKTTEPLSSSVPDLQQQNPDEAVEDDFTVVVSKKHKRHRLRQSSSELSADDMCHADISDSVHLAAEHTVACTEVHDISLNCTPAVEQLNTCRLVDTITSNPRDISNNIDAEKLASYYPAVRTLAALATGVLHAPIRPSYSDTDGICAVESNTVEPEHSIAQSSDSVPLANNYPTVQHVLQLNDIRRELSNDIESSNETLARLAKEYPVIQESTGLYQLMSHAGIATQYSEISKVCTGSHESRKVSQFEDADRSACIMVSKVNASQQICEENLVMSECKKLPSIILSRKFLLNKDLDIAGPEALALPEHEVTYEQKLSHDVKSLPEFITGSSDISMCHLNGHKLEADKHLNVFMSLSALHDFEIGKFCNHSKSENISSCTTVVIDCNSSAVAVVAKEVPLNEDEFKGKKVPCESLVKSNEPLSSSTSDLPQQNPEEAVEDDSFTVVVNKKHKRHRLRQSSSELSADDMCHTDISDSVYMNIEHAEDCKKVPDISLNCTPPNEDVKTCLFMKMITSNSSEIGISIEADKLASYYPGLRTLSTLATGVLHTSIQSGNSDTDGVCSVESNTVKPDNCVDQSSDKLHCLQLANNYPTVQQVLQLNESRRKLSNDIESSNETLARLAEEYPVIRESIGLYQLANKVIGYTDVATREMEMTNISSDEFVKESDYQYQSAGTTDCKISLPVSQQLKEDALNEPLENECEKVTTDNKSSDFLLKEEMNYFESKEILRLPKHQSTIVQLSNDVKPLQTVLSELNSFSSDITNDQLNGYMSEADRHLSVFVGLSALHDFEIGKFWNYTKEKSSSICTTLVSENSSSVIVTVDAKELLVSTEEIVSNLTDSDSMVKTNEPCSVSDLQLQNPEEAVEDESFTVVVSKKHKRHRLRQSLSELSADDMCHGDISDSVHLAAEHTSPDEDVQTCAVAMKHSLHHTDTAEVSVTDDFGMNDKMVNPLSNATATPELMSESPIMGTSLLSSEAVYVPDSLSICEMNCSRRMCFYYTGLVALNDLESGLFSARQSQKSHADATATVDGLSAVGSPDSAVDMTLDSELQNTLYKNDEFLDTDVETPDSAVDYKTVILVEKENTMFIDPTDSCEKKEFAKESASVPMQMVKSQLLVSDVFLATDTSSDLGNVADAERLGRYNSALVELNNFESGKYHISTKAEQVICNSSSDLCASTGVQSTTDLLSQPSISSQLDINQPEPVSVDPTLVTQSVELDNETDDCSFTVVTSKRHRKQHRHAVNEDMPLHPESSDVLQLAESVELAGNDAALDIANDSMAIVAQQNLGNTEFESIDDLALPVHSCLEERTQQLPFGDTSSTNLVAGHSPSSSGESHNLNDRRNVCESTSECRPDSTHLVVQFVRQDEQLFIPDSRIADSLRLTSKDDSKSSTGLCDEHALELVLPVLAKTVPSTTDVNDEQFLQQTSCMQITLLEQDNDRLISSSESVEEIQKAVANDWKTNAEQLMQNYRSFISLSDFESGSFTNLPVNPALQFQLSSLRDGGRIDDSGDGQTSKSEVHMKNVNNVHDIKMEKQRQIEESPSSTVSPYPLATSEIETEMGNLKDFTDDKEFLVVESKKHRRQRLKSESKSNTEDELLESHTIALDHQCRAFADETVVMATENIMVDEEPTCNSVPIADTFHNDILLIDHKTFLASIEAVDIILPSGSDTDLDFETQQIISSLTDSDYLPILPETEQLTRELSKSLEELYFAPDDGNIDENVNQQLQSFLTSVDFGLPDDECQTTSRRVVCQASDDVPEGDDSVGGDTDVQKCAGSQIEFQAEDQQQQTDDDIIQQLDHERNVSSTLFCFRPDEPQERIQTSSANHQLNYICTSSLDPAETTVKSAENDICILSSMTHEDINSACYSRLDLFLRPDEVLTNEDAENNGVQSVVDVTSMTLRETESMEQFYALNIAWTKRDEITSANNDFASYQTDIPQQFNESHSCSERLMEPPIKTDYVVDVATEKRHSSVTNHEDAINLPQIIADKCIEPATLFRSSGSDDEMYRRDVGLVIDQESRESNQCLEEKIAERESYSNVAVVDNKSGAELSAIPVASTKKKRNRHKKKNKPTKENKDSADDKTTPEISDISDQQHQDADTLNVPVADVTEIGTIRASDSDQTCAPFSSEDNVSNHGPVPELSSVVEERIDTSLHLLSADETCQPQMFDTASQKTSTDITSVHRSKKKRNRKKAIPAKSISLSDLYQTSDHDDGVKTQEMPAIPTSHKINDATVSEQHADQLVPHISQLPLTESVDITRDVVPDEVPAITSGDDPVLHGTSVADRLLSDITPGGQVLDVPADKTKDSNVTTTDRQQSESISDECECTPAEQSMKKKKKKRKRQKRSKKSSTCSEDSSATVETSMTELLSQIVAVCSSSECSQTSSATSSTDARPTDKSRPLKKYTRSNASKLFELEKTADDANTSCLAESAENEETEIMLAITASVRMPPVVARSETADIDTNLVNNPSLSDANVKSRHDRLSGGEDNGLPVEDVAIGIESIAASASQLCETLQKTDVSPDSMPIRQSTAIDGQLNFDLSADSEVERIFASGSQQSPPCLCPATMAVEEPFSSDSSREETTSNDSAVDSGDIVVITEYLDVEIVEETETVTVIESFYEPSATSPASTILDDDGVGSSFHAVPDLEYDEPCRLATSRDGDGDVVSIGLDNMTQDDARPAEPDRVAFDDRRQSPTMMSNDSLSVDCGIDSTLSDADKTPSVSAALEELFYPQWLGKTAPQRHLPTGTGGLSRKRLHSNENIDSDNDDDDDDDDYFRASKSDDLRQNHPRYDAALQFMIAQHEPQTSHLSHIPQRDSADVAQSFILHQYDWASGDDTFVLNAVDDAPPPDWIFDAVDEFKGQPPTMSFPMFEPDNDAMPTSAAMNVVDCDAGEDRKCFDDSLDEEEEDEEAAERCEQTAVAATAQCVSRVMRQGDEIASSETSDARSNDSLDDVTSSLTSRAVAASFGPTHQASISSPEKFSDDSLSKEERSRQVVADNKSTVIAQPIPGRVDAAKTARAKELGLRSKKTPRK